MHASGLGQFFLLQPCCAPRPGDHNPNLHVSSLTVPTMTCQLSINHATQNANYCISSIILCSKCTYPSILGQNLVPAEEARTEDDLGREPLAHFAKTGRHHTIGEGLLMIVPKNETVKYRQWDLFDISERTDQITVKRPNSDHICPPRRSQDKRHRYDL